MIKYPFLALGLVCASLIFLGAQLQQHAFAAPPRSPSVEELTNRLSSSPLPPLATSGPKPRDFVENDEEFSKLLERFRKESVAARAAGNPADFVSDEVELEELLKFLDEKEALEALARHESSPATTTIETSSSEPTATTGQDEGAEVERLLYDNEEGPEFSGPATTTTDAVNPNAATSALTRGDSGTVSTAPETTTIDAPAPTTWRPEPVIASDDEYEAILKRLKDEALVGISHPADYVTSDDELAFVLDKLNEGESFLKSRLDRWENNLPLVAGKCPICLDEMEPTEERELRCRHKFHQACIRAWARQFIGRHATCPLCRRSMHSDYL